MTKRFVFDDVFYGTRRVTLVPAVVGRQDSPSAGIEAKGGVWVPIAKPDSTHGPCAPQWQPDRSPDAVERVRRRARPYDVGLTSTRAAGWRTRNGQSASSRCRLVMPCMPVTDYSCEQPVAADAPAAGGEPIEASPVGAVQAFLAVPMMKTKSEGARPADTGGYDVAAASGVRSALVHIPAPRIDGNGHGAPGTWLRLKGCGNSDEGFVLRYRGGAPDDGAAVEDEPPLAELRGCAFGYSAVAECVVGQRLDAAFAARFGSRDVVVAANEPLGVWRYPWSATPLDAPSATEETATTPACAIFRTRGDRRLGTHVLGGLEMLLPLMLEMNEQSGSRCVMDTILAAFPAARPREPPLPPGATPAAREMRSPGGVVSAACLAAEAMLARVLGPDSVAHRCGVTRQVLGDARTIRTSALPSALRSTPSSTVLSQVMRLVNATSAVHVDDVTLATSWEPVWTSFYRAVVGEPPESATSAADGVARLLKVFSYAYWRIGFECGQFLAALHDEGTSWGTFSDALCHEGQLHCNAHSNNFVLLDPRGQETAAAPAGNDQEARRCYPYLGYLDLDMAFTRDTYVDVTNAENEPRGLPSHTAAAAAASGSTMSAAEFKAAFLEVERDNLLEVLCGADSNLGVSSRAKQQQRDVFGDPPEVIRLLQTLLTDTLAVGFLDGEDAVRRAAPHGAPEAADDYQGDLPTLHDRGRSLLALAAIARFNELA